MSLRRQARELTGRDLRAGRLICAPEKRGLCIVTQTASGTLTFNPGETSKTITVSVIGDTVKENDETFRVQLRNPTGGAVLADANGLGTIKPRYRIAAGLTNP